MEIKPGEIPPQSMYKLMIGSILPRPIGWISSIDENGCYNLAPFSFFNAICANPPHVLFCPMTRSPDHQAKDSLRNVRRTGEFVANIVSEPLLHAMNITSTEFPHEIDEFKAAGLTAIPSLTVKPPRVGESLVSYECKVVEIVDLGNEPDDYAGSVVIGRVLHLHVDDSILIGTDKIDLAKLQPLGRLAGNFYCRTTDILELARPPSQIK